MHSGENTNGDNVVNDPQHEPGCTFAETYIERQVWKVSAARPFLIELRNNNSNLLSSTCRHFNPCPNLVTVSRISLARTYRNLTLHVSAWWATDSRNVRHIQGDAEHINAILRPFFTISSPMFTFLPWHHVHAWHRVQIPHAKDGK